MLLLGILRSGTRGRGEGFEREGEKVNQREIRGWDLWFVILGGSRIKSFSIFTFQQKSTESKRMLKKAGIQ